MPESLNSGESSTAKSAVTDANGAPIVAHQYAWSETGGALTLSDADTAEVSFVANQVPAETVATLTITVTNLDGTTATFSDTVNVFGSGPVVGDATAVTFAFGPVVPAPTPEPEPVPVPEPEPVGIFTSSSSTTFTDTSATDTQAAWTPDVYKGWTLAAGPSSATVDGNTDTTLTLSSWIGGTPADGTTFVATAPAETPEEEAAEEAAEPPAEETPETPADEAAEQPLEMT
jgi:hypothetical protein